MSIPKVPYLCGGILFTLILQARKTRTKARDKYSSGSDGLSETATMMGFIEAVTGNSLGSCQGNTFGKVTSQFKTCQAYGATYIPFAEPSFISSFAFSVQKKDPDLLKRMSRFVENYINEMKSEWLVKAIFEVIEQDEGIDVNTIFFVTQNIPVKKRELAHVIDVELPVFLLSAFNFIINKRTDNTMGRSTFEAWHTKSSAKSSWKYCSNVGNSITRPITVKFVCNAPHVDTISTAYAENPASKKQNTTCSEFVGLPEEQPSNEYPYSTKDKLLLQDFTADYDKILLTLMSENYAASLIDMSVPNSIKYLYSTKWCSRADNFVDPTLKSYVFGLLGELNALNDSFFYTSTLNHSIKSIRMKIRNLYIKLHPDLFATTFPYDAFIDDWNDGEF